jgi:hypothetical protein
LPEVTRDKPDKKKFKAYPVGYFPIDIAEVHTEIGRLYLFVAIDRTSKFALAQRHERATRRVAGDFLRALIVAVPNNLRVHLQNLDRAAAPVHNRSNSPHPGTKHLPRPGQLVLAGRS